MSTNSLRKSLSILGLPFIFLCDCYISYFISNYMSNIRCCYFFYKPKDQQFGIFSGLCLLIVFPTLFIIILTSHCRPVSHGFLRLGAGWSRGSKESVYCLLLVIILHKYAFKCVKNFFQNVLIFPVQIIVKQTTFSITINRIQ